MSYNILFEQVRWLCLLSIAICINIGIECYYPKNPPVPYDIVFEYLPYNKSEAKLLIVTIGVLVSLVWAVICSFYYHEYILFKWWTILYFIRCLSIVTPQGVYRQSTYDFPDIVLNNMCPLFPTISMYSGHVGFILTLIRYAKKHKWQKIYWLLHVFNGFQIMVLLESRGHYSNEIVIGFIIGYYVT
jgi:hypothetical protein